MAVAVLQRMPGSDIASADEYLARAVALGPVLRQRAQECERLRRVPAETIADFTAAGFFDILKPRRHGGAELDPLVFLRVCIEIARHCGSSAWVLAIVGIHNWRLALYPDQAADDVWSGKGKASPLIAASTPPSGKATRVPGGFRISGRWPFASGVDHCGWAFLAAKVPVGTEGRVSLQYLLSGSPSGFRDRGRMACRRAQGHRHEHDRRRGCLRSRSSRQFGSRHGAAPQGSGEQQRRSALSLSLGPDARLRHCSAGHRHGSVRRSTILSARSAKGRRAPVPTRLAIPMPTF